MAAVLLVLSPLPAWIFSEQQLVSDFPVSTILSPCECEVFTNGLVQTDIGKLGCSFQAPHGPEGDKTIRTWCAKPRKNMIPMMEKPDDRCDHEQTPCRVTFKQVPEPYPFCACSSYKNHASPKDAFLCQMKPQVEEATSDDGGPGSQYAFQGPAKPHVLASTPVVYSAFPATVLGSCDTPNPNQVPSKVGILHDLGCPDNMFFCQANRTIADIVATDPQMTILLELLIKANLVGLFTDPKLGPYTVFAPTNAAFLALPPQALAFLTEPANVPQLQAVLTYHVLQDQVVPTAEFANEKTFVTAQGSSVVGRKVGNNNQVNYAFIVGPDELATNGVVQKINSVLNFQTISEIISGNVDPEGTPTTTLTAGLQATLPPPSLFDVLNGPGPFTLLAPTDAALAAPGLDPTIEVFLASPSLLLPALLKYHVLPEVKNVSTLVDDIESVTLGTTLSTPSQPQFITVEESEGVVSIQQGFEGQANIRATIPAFNGIIHFIDRVLSPPE